MSYPTYVANFTNNDQTLQTGGSSNHTLVSEKAINYWLIINNNNNNINKVKYFGIMSGIQKWKLPFMRTKKNVG